MIIGILKEFGTEKRVAMLPAEVGKLKDLGVEVIIENSAGEKAFISDENYISEGAQITSRKVLFPVSSIIARSPLPMVQEVSFLNPKPSTYNLTVASKSLTVIDTWCKPLPGMVVLSFADACYFEDWWRPVGPGVALSTRPV